MPEPTPKSNKPAAGRRHTRPSGKPPVGSQPLGKPPLGEPPLVKPPLGTPQFDVPSLGSQPLGSQLLGAPPIGAPPPRKPPPIQTPGGPSTRVGRSLMRGLRAGGRRPSIMVPGLVVLLFCIMALFPGLFAGWFGHPNPRECTLAKTAAEPASGHPFGFDVQGCDLYANVIYGARASISVGLLTTVATLVIAVVLGTLAAYYGGWVDMIISRVMDVFFGFPALVGMIVLLSAWQQHTVLTISAMLTLFTWPTLTRVMRGSVLSVVNLEYVSAARGLGAGSMRILTRHVGLNALGPVIVVAGLNIGAVITAEAALTFLGVGLESPTISWGVQLHDAQQFFTASPHLLLFPSLFLTLTVLSFVLVGDAIRDVLDPKLR